MTGLILVDSGLGRRGRQRAAAARISCSTRWRGHASSRRDGAQASRGSGLPPERCAPHRADPSRPRPRGRDLRFPRRRGPRFRRRAFGGLAPVEPQRAKPLPPRADRRGQEMGGGRGRGRILVWLFGRARNSRNARRGAAGARCPAIRAGIAASRSGEQTIGCSIAATPISITPKSSRTAAPRRRACAGSSRA